MISLLTLAIHHDPVKCHNCSFLTFSDDVESETCAKAANSTNPEIEIERHTGSENDNIDSNAQSLESSEFVEFSNYGVTTFTNILIFRHFPRYHTDISTKIDTYQNCYPNEFHRRNMFTQPVSFPQSIHKCFGPTWDPNADSEYLTHFHIDTDGNSSHPLHKWLWY